MQFEDSMNDSCHLSWPMRPVDAAYMRQRSRLAVSPPTPPQSAQAKRFVRSQFRKGGGDDTCQAAAEECPDVNADPKLKLGDVLGMVKSLIAGQELQAATLLLDQLAFSKMAETELTCTQSVFKCQVAGLLDRHVPEASEGALAVIEECIEQDSKIESKGEVKRMPTPPSTSSTAGSARRPQFRFLRQKQSPSQTLQGAEASEDDSSDETCVPSSGSSCQDSDEDWDLDYEALRRSSASCVHDGDDVSLDRLRMAFGTLSFDASHLVNDGPQDDHSER